MARSKGALEVFAVNPAASEPKKTLLRLEGQYRSFRIAPASGHLIAALPSSFRFYTFSDPKVVQTSALDVDCEWTEYSVSPDASHISLVDRQRRLRVYNIPSSKLVYEEPGVSSSGTGSMAPRWSANSRSFLRVGKQPGELLLYSVSNVVERKTFNVGGIHDYSYSPEKHDLLALFSRASGSSTPASAGLYRILDTEKGPELSQVAVKTFFKADRAEFAWAKGHDSVLVTTSADVDTSGQSYYGQTALYLLRASRDQKPAVQISLNKEGPVHDVAWAQSSASGAGTEFTALFGYMPAQVAVFGGKSGVQTYSYESGSIGSKNTVRAGPASLVAFAGLGNLPGKVELWSRERLCRVGALEAPGSSVIEWSPALNSEPLLLTAVTHPRLRVDNGWKAWKWTGSLLCSSEYSELYQCAWWPAIRTEKGATVNGLKAPELDSVALKVASRLSSMAPAKKAEAYRPPSLRTPSPLPSSSSEQSATATATSKAPHAAARISKEERLVRRMEERLDQIIVLRDRRAKGDALDENQLEKIGREAEVRRELEAALSLLKSMSLR